VQAFGPQLGMGESAIVPPLPLPVQAFGPQLGIGELASIIWWLPRTAEWDVRTAAEAPAAQIPRTKARRANFMMFDLLNLCVKNLVDFVQHLRLYSVSWRSVSIYSYLESIKQFGYCST
jgi:hypothetical protein